MNASSSSKARLQETSSFPEANAVWASRTEMCHRDRAAGHPDRQK